MEFQSNIKTFLSSSAFVAAIISSPLQAGQVTFTEIPTDITTRESLSNVSVSDEGTVVFSHNHDLYKWNSLNGLVTLGEFPEVPFFFTNGTYAGPQTPFVDANISADGQVIAFNYFSSSDLLYRATDGSYLAYVYVNDTLEHVLGDDNLHTNRAKDLSPDGTTLGGAISIGEISEETYTYIPNSFMWSGQDLSVQGQNTHFSYDTNKFTLGDRLFTIDTDGNRTSQVIPQMHKTSFNWTHVRDISGDGNIVIGRFDDFKPGRWNSTTDTLDDLGAGITPQSTNYDGSIIIGLYGGIWDEVNGTRNIRDMLSTSGIDLSDWRYIRLSEISKDGTYIVGWGENPEGFVRAFLITSIPECTAGLF